MVGDNRLRFYQDLHFEYDVHGNVVRRTRGNRRAGHHETAELRWNADHQLVEATSHRNGVTQATRYAYDALGRRVAKADVFGTTRYLWDGDLMVHSQRGGKASLFVYEPGSFVPLATVQGMQQPGDSRIYWYQCDQIGAPLELTDARGHIAWAADYKVWGEATLRALPSQATGTDGMAKPRRHGHGPDAMPPMRSAAPRLIEQPFRFQGQQFDEETGLHYNRFRYYDPSVGRFVGQDPIGLAGGVNTLLFGPNPIYWADPLGLACIPQKIEGSRREQESTVDLTNQHSGARVQNEVYLRTKDGKRAIDPLTGTGRRIDHVVIDNINGTVICCCETTSLTADKREQTDKENRIRENGGHYIRDRKTNELLDVKDKPTKIIRRK
ncbi:RHS repeat-associated core domain-containing protein [Acidovorax sp. PRC11]|uniref:RHS repeat-associated core domain-containing protein n=1 Tax=Acidovorax sp. PRC11 TaxID=2962592 RepID=UPI00288126CE|nr:RHS repeat-associated core domain-containing protein [Acidovorax sp. PRC11]MDT0137220.1 RHS repeat-associated core domain-containing protein [Acidovorax sp. PRC11]